MTRQTLADIRPIRQKGRMRPYLISLSVALFCCLAPLSAHAQKAEVYTSWRNDLAVGGFDAVSFHAGKPIEGRDTFETIYRDVVWRFNTQANMDLFLMNPEAFAPQYGGYCAWAVAKGKLAPGKPEHWHVEDGRLYLNYSKRVKKRWDALRDEFIDQADARWPALLDD
ncbi:MAG: YHS domain-containing (seleno)protein [Pseudomonadota bacterium]